MREVEFRGYDKDTKRWYYGSYARLERSTPYPMSQDPEGDAKKFEAEQVDHYIFFTESSDWGLPTRKLKATIDPKSVGEWTGARDKNNRKIYEGDRIRGVVSKKREFVCQGLQLDNKMGKGVEGIVQYSTSYCQFYFTTDGITYLDLLLGLEDIEVIGNTYEDNL